MYQLPKIRVTPHGYRGENTTDFGTDFARISVIREWFCTQTVTTTLNYSERDLHTLDVKVEKLLHSMKKTLRLKTEPFKWTFVKFNMTTHVTWWIKRFGHCGQTDAATLERLHKIVRYVFTSLSVTSLIHVPQRCIT